MRFSLEAEQSVIGGLLLDCQRFDDVAEIISADDFYNIDNKAIFQAIATMSINNSPVDVVTLSEQMHEDGTLEAAGGLCYLIEIANNTPSSANLKSYARIVADRAMERKFTDAGNRIVEIGEDAQIAIDEKINLIHSEFSSLERHEKTEIMDFDKLLKAEVQDIDARFNGQQVKGVMTGFAELDKRFGGIEKDDLWILAARPSMGKTTLAMNIAQNVANQGKSVLIFSLEMGKEQLTKRLLSAASSIPYGILRSGELTQENWPQLTAGMMKLKGKKIHIVDIAGIDVNRAMAIARKYARYGDLGLIVVDYLQLMTARTDSRFDEVSEVSRKLKAMAKNTGCPVLALSQLNRDVEKRKIPIPNNSDLRESGQIEQDADIISFIYRDEVYFPDTMEKGIAQVITTKFRNGEVGTDYISSKLQFSRFEDLHFAYQPAQKEVAKTSRGFN
jgi:replicative DNA helicase